MIDRTPWLETLGSVQWSALGDCHFGDPAAEAARALTGTIVVPLAHLGLIEAAGADAATFLQGQLSNDVRLVSASRAQLSSFNSAKGRMLAVLHLLRAKDSFLLELHRPVLESTLKRLRMYVLRSRVTLAELTDRLSIGIAGPEASLVLSQLGLPVPAAPLECAWSDDIGIVHRQGKVPRYSVLVPAPAAANLWKKMAAHAMPAGTQAWKLLDILAGLPAVYPATQDRFVPQMCNLDQLGGISFSKGCYTGQEIVARVHYRGAVKRQMRVVRTPETGVPPGATLALPDGSKGEVVESAPHPEGGMAALVVAGETAG